MKRLFFAMFLILGVISQNSLFAQMKTDSSDSTGQKPKPFFTLGTSALILTYLATFGLTGYVLNNPNSTQSQKTAVIIPVVLSMIAPSVIQNWTRRNPESLAKHPRLAKMLNNAPLMTSSLIWGVYGLSGICYYALTKLGQ
ncbi:MAG: hypothetical protein JWQ35_2529 [Bacteriovoracaceae bacterium]|nr:hypothetical protein [Bacteriovoracaceae bacterium]